MLKQLFLSLLFLSPTIAMATNIPMKVALLRGLDKVTGRISTFSVPVGEVFQFGRTYVIPESCYTRPPEESPENAAYLYIYEKSAKGENIELFKGWMFSSNPALSSMEHPVYDIWVIDCVDSKDTLSDNAPLDTEPLDETEVLSQEQVNEIIDDETQVEENTNISSPVNAAQNTEIQ